MPSTKRVRYATVNASWPEVMPVPTGPEAITAVKRLYRFAMGKPWKGKVQLTSGRRHTWPRYGIYYVNPNREGWSFSGWKDIVHAVSHYCHRRLYPGKRPHDHRHEWLEKEMINYVVSHGWLDGKLKRAKPEAPKSDPKQIRYQRICNRIATWERKERRAKTALRKLVRTKTYYERTLTQ